MNAIKYALLGLVGVIGLVISAFGPIKVPYAEALAKSYYRYALGALLLILLLVTVSIGLFILTFDANNFKSEIIQFVKERTQRDLVIEGNIKVTFFPNLGLDSGRASLSQRNSAREFASINNTRLYIAWLPLLRHRLVFNHMEIDGIRINLTRMKDGSTNFDDLLISDEHLAPLTFDIDSVHVTDSAINWLDEMESQRVTLQNLQLVTGRLADMVPSHLTASFRLDSERAHLNSSVHLKSRLFFDRKAGRYEFEEIEGKLAGEASMINDLALDFAGSINSYPAQGLLTAANFNVTATGRSGQRLVESRLSVPKLQIDKGNLNGSRITLDMTSSYLDESATATVQLPAFEIANKVFKTAELTADLDFKADERALRAKLASPVSVSFESAPMLQLDAIVLSLTARHPALSGELAANVTGSIRADLAEQKANLGFNAKIDDSKIAGKITLKGFSHPEYTVDISANHLNLDRYVSIDWLKRLQDDATPFNLAGLKDATLRGRLRAGEIKLAKIKASKLTAGIKLDQSILTVAPIAARLYGGVLTGSISIAAQGTPQITIKQSLRNIQMSALLADTASAGRLAGKGSIALDVSAEGSSVSAWRKALNGRASLALVRGSIAGIDLRAALLEGRSELETRNAARVRETKFTEKTEFSELKATFNIKDGDAIGNSFEMRSPLIKTTGEGDITLGSGNLNYRLNAVVYSSVNRRTAGELAELKGVTVPICVSGSFAAPSIALDFASASGGNVARLSAANAAKAVATSQASSSKGKARNTKPEK